MGRAGRSPTVAEILRPVLDALVGGAPPVTIRMWDGSHVGPTRGPATIVVRSPRALRRILWAPGELGLARAFVSGDIDIEGDIFAALGVRDALSAPDQPMHVGLGARTLLPAIAAARRVGALGLPPPPPPEEAHLKGRRHSKARDAAAISHHYDVSNDFYQLLLGATLTYSCAYFERDDSTLDEAQTAKYDLICRKLGLREGMRFLDVGCGWGGMAMHAAERYGVDAVGVTISTQQAELASARVAAAGLSSRVQIRLQDYRDVTDGPYDAISSIGMFEHVGLSRLGEYLGALHGLLRPRGRLLNHGISRPSGPPALHPRSFIGRYVFPDGELHEVGTVVSAIQSAHLEVRDVESLREHYARTLRAWITNLEAGWDRAVELVGPSRARIWRLYIAGSALNFESNRTSIHQVLAVRAGDRGASGMPPTRAEVVGLVPATAG